MYFVDWGIITLLRKVGDMRRKNQYKKIIRMMAYALTLLFAVSILGGCGKKAEDSQTAYQEPDLITVGFSQVGAESDWRVANTESFRKTMTRNNGVDFMFDDAQQKQDKQIIAIRNFVQQEVDYIVLAPVMETGWDTVLQEANDADIPVIIVDRMVDVEDASLYKAWIGSDFKREGKIACEWLNKFTIAKGIAPENINIVDIQGTEGATSQIGRTNGLTEAANQYGWNILAMESADYAQTKGKEVVANLLKEYDNINVVYCENDNEAMGAIEAIEEAGKKPGTDIENGEILIISFDAAHSGLSQVLAGKIALDVECNPLQGKEVLNVINAIENGEEYNKYTYINESIFALDDTVKTVNVDDTNYDITIVTEDIMNSREY